LRNACAAWVLCDIDKGESEMRNRYQKAAAIILKPFSSIRNFTNAPNQIEIEASIKKIASNWFLGILMPTYCHEKIEDALWILCIYDSAIRSERERDLAKSILSKRICSW